MEANSSSGSASETATSKNMDGCKPLWKYVTILNKDKGGPAGVPWRCNFCKLEKRTTYTRVVNHLLKKGEGIQACKDVSTQDMANMLKLIEEDERKQRAAAPKNVPLPSSSTMYSSEVYKSYDGSKKRKESASTSTALGKAFNVQAHNTLDALIARMFYSSGLPFHLARSPYYGACFTFAANNNIAGYVPPNYNQLRMSLLQQEKANVEYLLQPIKGTWREKGVSIVSDGWSDSQRRPLINFMAVTESGPMFFKAVDCSGEIKDKFFIFNLLKEVIEEIGPQNVVQVITDNARNCQTAGLLVEGLYPNILVDWKINYPCKAIHHIQPSSSSCAERNWSTYSFIHSVRRNKIMPKRAEDLVYIHSNLRLLSRRTPEYFKGETKMWDIGGDNFGTFEDVGDLEIAQLSLDELEMESVVFNEDRDDMDTDADDDI